LYSPSTAGNDEVVSYKIAISAGVPASAGPAPYVAGILIRGGQVM
jgi:hypothetical protein